MKKKSQRESGWPLDSWSEETPFPDPFPNSIYNRGQEIKGGLFLEWGAIPNDREEEMADTMRINWAVEKLKEKRDKPFFLAVGIYAPHFPNYCPQKYFDLYNLDEIEHPPYKTDDLDDLPEKIRRATNQWVAPERVQASQNRHDQIRVDLGKRLFGTKWHVVGYDESPSEESESEAKQS